MIILFSGYNQRAVIAFLRTLRKCKVEDYVIVATTDDDTIFNTIYKDKVEYVRERELSLEVISSILDDIDKRYNACSYLIPPTTEFLVRFFQDNREYFEKRKCILPLVKRELYNLISDKRTFYDDCKANGILVPKINNVDVTIPSVAKPKQYKSKSGHILSPVIIENLSEWNEFQSNFDKNEFDIQEYIFGESLYLLFYFGERKVYRLVQKNLIQLLNGKSMIAAELDDENKHKSILDRYQTYFNNKAFKGFVMVEVRRNDKNYYMIEANPRFWGPSQLFVDSGYNFFEIFLSEYGYLNDSVEVMVTNRDAKYFWSDGIGGKERKYELCNFHIDNKEEYFAREELFWENDLLCREDIIR